MFKNVLNSHIIIMPLIKARWAKYRPDYPFYLIRLCPTVKILRLVMMMMIIIILHVILSYSQLICDF